MGQSQCCHKRPVIYFLLSVVRQCEFNFLFKGKNTALVTFEITSLSHETNAKFAELECLIQVQGTKEDKLKQRKRKYTHVACIADFLRLLRLWRQGASF